MAELHGDVFSRHASHLENYVFVGVDERGEDIVSDEICRRNYRKQKRRRGGRSATLRLGYEQNQKSANVLLLHGSPNEVTSVGRTSERRKKSEPFCIMLFRIHGPCIY